MGEVKRAGGTKGKTKKGPGPAGTEGYETELNRRSSIQIP